MLIAVFHDRQTDAAGSAPTGGVPAGAAVSWVSGRFLVHGRGEVSVAELAAMDAAGALSWVDPKAREWVRSQTPGRGPAFATDVHPGVAASGPRFRGVASSGAMSGQRRPAWQRISAEHYRIATYVVVGIVVLLVIVLISDGAQ